MEARLLFPHLLDLENVSDGRSLLAQIARKKENHRWFLSQLRFYHGPKFGGEGQILSFEDSAFLRQAYFRECWPYDHGENPCPYEHFSFLHNRYNIFGAYEKGAEEERPEDPRISSFSPLSYFVSPDRCIFHLIQESKRNPHMNLSCFAQEYVVFSALSNLGTWIEKAIHKNDFASLIVWHSSICLAVDVYGSVNTFFKHSRKTECLQHLNTCYIDIDYYNVPTLKDKSPQEINQLIHKHLSTVGLPAPDGVLFSGRGLQCFWFFAPLGVNAMHDKKFDAPLPHKPLHRWRTLQRILFEALKSFGADPKSLDPSRVFRLAGTVNSKTGEVIGWVKKPFEYFDFYEFWVDRSFEELEALIKKSAAYNAIAIGLPDMIKGNRSFSIDNAEKKPKSYSNIIRPKKEGEGTVIQYMPFSSRRYAEIWIQDLEKLWKDRWNMGPVAPGYRNEFCFQYCIALAWLHPAKDLENLCQMMAARIGIPPHERAKIHSTLIKKARETAQSKEKTGIFKDIRYKLSTQSALYKLDITDEEIIALNLRALVSKKVAQQRDAQYHKIQYFLSKRELAADLPQDEKALLALIEQSKEQKKKEKEARKAAEKAQKAREKEEARLMRLQEEEALKAAERAQKAREKEEARLMRLQEEEALKAAERAQKAREKEEARLMRLQEEEALKAAEKAQKAREKEEARLMRLQEEEALKAAERAQKAREKEEARLMRLQEEEALKAVERAQKAKEEREKGWQKELAMKLYQKGWTQLAIAKELGVLQRTISRWLER